VRVDRILAAMSQNREFCVFISHEQKRQVFSAILLKITTRKPISIDNPKQKLSQN
jgi:hypothetical protein